MGLPLLWIFILGQYPACTEAAATSLDILLFGSLDGGAGTFVSAGAKIASRTLSDEGLLALLTAGGGTRTERIGCSCGQNHTLSHRTAVSSAMLGYQWVMPEGVVAAFVGGESVLDAYGAATSAIREGVRLQAEAWIRPTEKTLFTTTLVGGTARWDGWARLAWGHRVWDVYVGPEGSVYRDTIGYRKTAAGLHATDIAIADIRLRLSAGMQWETDHRGPAPYLAVSAWAPW